MHGASGRQILWAAAPLAAGAQNVHHAVDHLADSDAPFAAAGLARRDQRLDMRPFRIGQVARITQFVAVVARAVVGSPHGAPQEQIHHPRESQLIQLFKRGRRIPIHPTHKVPGTDTKFLVFTTRNKKSVYLSTVASGDRVSIWFRSANNPAPAARLGRQCLSRPSRPFSRNRQVCASRNWAWRPAAHRSARRCFRADELEQGRVGPVGARPAVAEKCVRRLDGLVGRELIRVGEVNQGLGIGGKPRWHLVPRRWVGIENGNQFAGCRDAALGVTGSGETQQGRDGSLGGDPGLCHITAYGGSFLRRIEIGQSGL